MRMERYTSPPPPPVVQSDWVPATSLDDLRLRFDTRRYAEPSTLNVSFERVIETLGFVEFPPTHRAVSLSEIQFLGACGLIQISGRKDRIVTREGHAILAEWRVCVPKCA